MFKNCVFSYCGQSTPDDLDHLSISLNLFNKHKNKENIIEIGGGYNGVYILDRVVLGDGDTGFLGYDETTNETGIDNIVSLVEILQDSMSYDGGAYISIRFLEGLKESATPDEYAQVLKNLRYPVQQYSGGSPIEPPN